MALKGSQLPGHLRFLRHAIQHGDVQGEGLLDSTPGHAWQLNTLPYPTSGRHVYRLLSDGQGVDQGVRVCRQVGQGDFILSHVFVPKGHI